MCRYRAAVVVGSYDVIDLRVARCHRYDPLCVIPPTNKQPQNIVASCIDLPCQSLDLLEGTHPPYGIPSDKHWALP